MHDGIKLLQIMRPQVTDVFTYGRHFGDIGPQGALIKIASIQANDTVAGCQEIGSHDRTEISVMSGDQDTFSHYGYSA